MNETEDDPLGDQEILQELKEMSDGQVLRQIALDLRQIRLFLDVVVGDRMQRLMEDIEGAVTQTMKNTDQ